MKRPFSKPATTHTQQVALLQQRGMIIDDPASAEFYLQHLNYYRLGAYWLPFESDHSTHAFRPGTSFGEVLNLYVFDRELRLLVLDAIERIEVSVRSQWAYQLAHQHGPHAHLDSALAYKPFLWRTNLDKLTEEVNRSDETFIKHLKAAYVEALPPVWAVCEVMSLGLLSRWYNNLKPMPIRRAIAAAYGVDEKVLESWLRHLSLVRNTCAHHSRLWNREFTITPLLPRSKPAGLAVQCRAGSRKLYNTLVILLHCMDVIAPRHHWRGRLKELIALHTIPVVAMDFPSGWEQMAIWQEKMV
ncbi:Abi family protein [Pseudogulbenkiania sp. MAI-1]|uniref:Abi family protein n=1 Tax=Pseudogulbenkiania sp. MAI-1 TaxID=990370 RepID=UPI00045E7CEB|nr:Abi family protein [Pseudogulbenkiania sp. MAI-1]